MGCGCKDRGAMISSMGKQALRGNVGAVARRAGAVVSSLAKDARTLASRSSRPMPANAAELARLRNTPSRR